MPDEEMKADQDWKDQAQAEKERLSKELDAEEQAERQMPPADFMAIVGQLGMQAAMCLGQPNPVTGEKVTDLAAARYYIDLVGVLQEKTEGNLTPEESEEVKKILTNLRMGFVAASSNPPPESAGESKPESKIITP